MSERDSVVYPYIPNSVPAVRAEMLREAGAENVEEFYADIPDHLRLRRPLDLPPAILSEAALRRHVEHLLARNRSCHEYLSFLGAGCYRHYVPAVCDEVNGRSEFLTAYAGEPYEDLGRFQALFEYTSMMGELLEMDVVNVPTYDGFQAAATALRMAARMTGRRQALLCAPLGAGRLSKFRDYCRPALDLELVGYAPATGQADLAALAQLASHRTAAVYIENPSYLGYLQEHADAIAGIAHACGAELVVAVDPSSLGVVAPPSQYGADIACGDVQPLGIHMQYGGGQGGFIATRDDPRYVMEFPSRLFGITSTAVPGEYGFGDVAFERTSFARREEGTEWVGTAAALWGITAGVYMALMGPQGFVELGTTIMQRAHYAASRIGSLPGIRRPGFAAVHFQEFVVNFDGTGHRVADINRALLAREIFGGHDLSAEMPELGQCALYCVTELHTQEDIDRLVQALGEVTR